MRKNKYSILSFCLIILHLTVFAQTKNTSNEMVIVDGIKFYKHNVQRGETINTLSKLYKTTRKEVNNANRSTLIGLRLGQTLLVPVNKQNDFSNNAQKTTKELKRHKVKKQQTVYSISKMYNISIDEIYKYNSHSKNGIKEGDTMLIPASEKSTDVFISEDDNYIYHKVEKESKLSSIALKYNINIKEVKKANPKLTDKLNIGTIVKIPKPSTISELNNKNNTDENTSIIDNDPLFYLNPNAPCHNFDYSKNKQSFKIALMLPLFIKQNQGIGLESKIKAENNSFYKNSKKFIEFYEGIILALDTLRKEGLSIELTVFDTEKDSTKVENILSENEEYLKSTNLIIGPVYNSNFKLVSNFSKTNNIKLINPLSKNKSLIKTNPNIYHVNSSLSMQIEMTAKYLSSLPYKNYIIVQSGSKAEEKTEPIISELYISKIREFTAEKDYGDSIQFKKFICKGKRFREINSLLSKEKENIIIVTSTKEVFVTDFTTKLNMLTKSYVITLIGMPNWQKFNNIELETLQNLRFHHYSTTYIDYSDFYVKEFIRKHRRTIQSDPTNFTFQGYDILYYFANALKTFGPNFQDCLSANNSVPDNKGLLLEFDFKRIENFSGFENTGGFIIKFDEEFNLVKANK